MWCADYDPYWNNVICLAGQVLGGDGAAPDPIDQSTAGQFVSVQGTPTWDYSEAPPLDGVPAALKVDGGTSYDRLQFADHSQWTLGHRDFTFEGWFNATSWPALGTLFKRRNVNGAKWIGVAAGHSSTQVLRWWASSGGAIWDLGSGVTIASGLQLNTWYHWAMCRYGTELYGYCNGVKGGSAEILASEAIVGTETDDVTWCADQGFNSWGLTGWAYAFRVTVGVCRYIGDRIEVPTTPFPARGKPIRVFMPQTPILRYDYIFQDDSLVRDRMVPGGAYVNEDGAGLVHRQIPGSAYLNEGAVTTRTAQQGQSPGGPYVQYTR